MAWRDRLRQLSFSFVLLCDVRRYRLERLRLTVNFTATASLSTGRFFIMLLTSAAFLDVKYVSGYAERRGRLHDVDLGGRASTTLLAEVAPEIDEGLQVRLRR